MIYGWPLRKISRSTYWVTRTEKVSKVSSFTYNLKSCLILNVFLRRHYIIYANLRSIYIYIYAYDCSCPFLAGVCLQDWEYYLASFGYSSCCFWAGPLQPSSPSSTSSCFPASRVFQFFASSPTFCCGSWNFRTTSEYGSRTGKTALRSACPKSEVNVTWQKYNTQLYPHFQIGLPSCIYMLDVKI